ncbi:semaphorin-5A-like isoform X2 [Dendronephthya gigantea]|uniref:semaphorin-5A-like isoform X2 n=1 Tax=Dendronephthya gigantea TaxID=151771 RepID=UPI00106CEBA8|nr:semaphorin-5A-like isoform X2 [Dendronephthya gigantea]
MRYPALCCVSLFINYCLVIALPEKDWSTQYKNYNKEFHVLLEAEDLKMYEFNSASIRNFTTFKFYNGSLIVGARNSILTMNITAASIQNVTEINWTPAQSQQRDSCILSGTPEDECHNFVKVLAFSKNKLLTCGTNSHYPTCMWREIDTLQKVSGTIPFSGQGLIDANPHAKSISTFSDDGRLFSAVPMGFGGNDKRILNTEFDSFQSFRVLHTKQNNPYWLDDVVFHQSFSIGKYVYFFFDEFGLECADCDPLRFSRVARICQGDDGGNTVLNWVNFVTFQKARLNCSSIGKYRYQFNSMRDIYWDAQKETFYGIFSMENSPEQTMSAVCSYSLSDVEKVFSGEVKYKDGKVWKKIKNPSHIKECTVDQSALRSSFSSSKDRMKTRSMTMKALKDQNKCILASDVVQTRTKTTPFYLDNISFEKVVVITIYPPSPNSSRSNKTDIWYITTDRGTILKLGKIPSVGEFCIFEEYKPYSDNGMNKTEQIKEMILSPEKNYLVIGSNNKLIRLSLANCDRYSSKRSCLSAQDPICGWSAIDNKCLSWDKGKAGDWEQNFTSCKERMQREAEWSAWSEWSECENSDGNLCKCRRRTCLFARLSYQCQGEDNELTNCTADISTLTNKNQWWVYGAIHGGWSNWSEWTECLRGYKNRTRTCSNPVPANGGLPCTETNMEYELCEPTRWDETETSLWTSWTRVRGPERRITRFKISCNSTSVVTKSLQLNVLRNETKNCTKELCIDPPKVKKRLRVLTNWSSWLYCNATTERLRTRHLCIKNISNHYWTCNEFGVESIDRPVTTRATSTSRPTTDPSTLDSTTTTKQVSSESTTVEITTKSQTSPTITTTKPSTLPNTPNIECKTTTPGTDPTGSKTSKDGGSSTTSTTLITTENATTSSIEDTTGLVSTLATELTTPSGKPDISTKSQEWSPWSVCLCSHDVILSNRSRGLQHRTLGQKTENSHAQYRSCPCEAVHATTTIEPDIKVRHKDSAFSKVI